jgi:arylformamidase
MGFDNLPKQSPLFPPEAEHYARRAMELSRQQAAKCDVIFDIPYGGDDWQKIDIYRPPEANNGSLPVLLFAHGGGWTHGHKEWMGLLAPAIISIPAIFISVSYRLAPEHRFPAPVEDCIAALRWVHDNIERLGGDASRISVGGHSAGGHLYALATVRHDMLRAAGLVPNVIKACFPVSARFNLVFANPEPGTSEWRINSLLLATPSDASSASPIHYLEDNRVPFYLAYGTRDFPNIIRSNEEMFELLRKHGRNVERLALSGYDHFDTALKTGDVSNPWPKMVRKAVVGSDT